MSRPLKKLAVLGSTGSIGRQVLDIVQAFPDRFIVTALAGGNNGSLFIDQLSRFKPKFMYFAGKLDTPSNVKSLSMEEIACHPDVDMVVVATSGKAGLNPTLAAIKASKKIALANKEVLVMAGEIVMKEARTRGLQILPIDSEHSAIFQCLTGETNHVNKIMLTASGGPFLNYSESMLADVTVEEALRHPTWKMGRKVTIDSATLMNKGLEAIEASWLFAVPLNKIEVVIHRQSIVHSLVEFADGSIKAQLGMPDMRLAIQYALSYPERLTNHSLPLLDLAKIKSLTFDRMDYSLFPCLTLAIDAGHKGGTYPAALCAADDIAVDLFLERRIAFTQIAEIVEKTLSLHESINRPTLDEIIKADEWARDTALAILSKVD